MNRHLRWGAVAAATSLAIALSACGGGSSSDEKASSGGTTKLRVTSLPLCEEIGLFAKDGGYFKKKDLDVDFVSATGGNAGVAALQAGAADVAFITATAALGAMSQGIDVKFISGAVRTGPQSNGVVVKEGSAIETAEDLVGKKVGVLELAGSGATSITGWVTKAVGGEPKIKFVQLPFPELVPGVLAGTVDAAQVTASEIFQLQKDGTGRSIGNPGYELAGGSIPTGMYVVTSDFLAKHEKAMEDFVAAMQEAADVGNDPADTKHFDVLSKYCKKPAADLAKVPQEGRSVYEGYIDRPSFERLVTVLRAGKAFPTDFKPEDKVADFAWKK